MSEETTKQTTSEKAGGPENGKTAGILAYLLVGIIWFFADEKIKRDEFAKFHVKQSLVLLIISIGGYIILGLIPVLGWIIMPFFGLATFAFAVLGIINAAQGQKKELPFIGGYASKLKF